MTAATSRPTRRTVAEHALLWLEVLLALGAYGGAIGLLTGAMDFGPATDDLPFGSTVLAGIALAVIVGLPPTVVFVAALRNQQWASAGHWIVGIALVGWILVQVGFLGWPPHWLQITYFIYGLTILWLAHRVGSWRRTVAALRDRRSG